MDDNLNTRLRKLKIFLQGELDVTTLPAYYKSGKDLVMLFGTESQRRISGPAMAALASRSHDKNVKFVYVNRYALHPITHLKNNIKSKYICQWIPRSVRSHKRWRPRRCAQPTSKSCLLVRRWHYFDQSFGEVDQWIQNEEARRCRFVVIWFLFILNKSIHYIVSANLTRFLYLREFIRFLNVRSNVKKVFFLSLRYS